jgi:DnaK suppressor protein
LQRDYLMFTRTRASGETMSDSHKELENVRLRLQSRRADLSNRRQRVERDLERVNEPLVADSSDRAIQQENDEPLAAIGSAAVQEIAAIDEALIRLDQDQYGICKRCGGLIPAERLSVIPYAVTCVGCGG